MKKARLVWVLAISLVISFDICQVACNDVPGDTLSEAVWAMNTDPLSFFLGLALGIVLGHLFWQRR